jgi:murein endopeptidase
MRDTCRGRGVFAARGTSSSQVLAPLITWLLLTGVATEAPAAVERSSVWGQSSSIVNPPAAWVRHVVSRYEDLDLVAELHGVTADELRKWNSIEAGAEPNRGDVLLVHTRRFPRPRQRIRFKVHKDESWEDAAARHGLDVDDLKRWNARFAKRRSPVGLHLHAWVESRVAPPGSGIRGPIPPQVTVPYDGLSIGKPYKGRLSRGVQLPESELYTVRVPRLAFGTSLAVIAIHRAIATFRHQTAFDGDIVIGAMSRQTGRRLAPHRSHQSGRDVDIRLPALAFADGQHALSAQEIDWPATWALVQAFANTEVVQVIFLEYRHFRRLRKGGLQMGLSPEEIEDVMGRVVRHAKGHIAHMHVRFICSPLAEQCGS